MLILAVYALHVSFNACSTKVPSNSKEESEVGEEEEDSWPCSFESYLEKRFGKEAVAAPAEKGLELGLGLEEGAEGYIDTYTQILEGIHAVDRQYCQAEGEEVQMEVVEGGQKEGEGGQMKITISSNEELDRKIGNITSTLTPQLLTNSFTALKRRKCSWAIK